MNVYRVYKGAYALNKLLTQESVFPLIIFSIVLGLIAYGLIYIQLIVRTNNRGAVTRKNSLILIIISILLSLSAMFGLRYLYYSLDYKDNEICRTGDQKLQQLYGCKNGKKPSIDEAMKEHNEFMEKTTREYYSD